MHSLVLTDDLSNGWTANPVWLPDVVLIRWPEFIFSSAFLFLLFKQKNTKLLLIHSTFFTGFCHYAMFYSFFACKNAFENGNEQLYALYTCQACYLARSVFCQWKVSFITCDLFFFITSVFYLCHTFQLKTPPICLPRLPPHLLQSTLDLQNKVGQEYKYILGMSLKERDFFF